LGRTTKENLPPNAPWLRAWHAARTDVIERKKLQYIGDRREKSRMIWTQ